MPSRAGAAAGVAGERVMGTRQEWGLVVLVLLLAAPALWPRHQPTAAADLPRCAHPQLIAGADAGARLRCLETAAPEREAGSRAEIRPPTAAVNRLPLPIEICGT